MVDEALGNLVHEYASDSIRLSLFEGGFRGVSRGQEIAARWEDVSFVKRFHQRATVAIVTIVSVRAEIHLVDGRVFVLEGNDERAALAAQYVGSLSSPHIARRMMVQLGAPGGVSFSADVRATAAGGVEVLRRGKWRSLPFDRIAGYKVTQGFCLIDENPASPRLFDQISLARLRNPDAFMTLLDIMAPGKDLDENPYPRTPGFFETTAATHDPRYLSMRARALGCLVVFGVLAAGGLVALVVVGIYMRAEDEQRSAAVAEMNREIETYGQALEQRVRAIAAATPPAATLREACAGKGADLKKVVVVLAAAEAGVTGLGKEPMPWYSMSDTYGFGYEKRGVDSVYPTALVARLLSGTAMSLDGTSVVKAHVQVYRDPGSPPLCEGIAEGRWVVTVSVGSLKEKAHLDGLLTSIVSGVCDKGSDAGACKQLARSGDIHFTEGPPPAPSGSGAAGPKGKAPKK